MILARHRQWDTGRTPLPLIQSLLIFLHDALEPRNVLQQALAGETEQVVAEFRILEVQLEQRFIGDGQDVAVLDALDRLRTPVFRRNEIRVHP